MKKLTLQDEDKVVGDAIKILMEKLGPVEKREKSIKFPRDS